MLGPAIYLYIRSRTEISPALDWRHLFHLVWIIPGLLFLLVNWWPLSVNEKRGLLSSGGLSTLTTRILLPVYADAVLLSYLIASVRKLDKFGLGLEKWFSNIEDRNLSGLRHLLSLFGLMIIFHLVWSLGRGYLFELEISAYVALLLSGYHLVLINGLYLEFLTHKYPSKESLKVLDGKPGHKRLPDEQSDSEASDQLAEDLQKAVKTQKPFLDPNLTISDLAKLLRVHPRQISNLINSNFQSNFFEYINRYRIEHAQTEIKKQPGRAILDIAYDSGFNSKSAFNSAFKRFTQLTPSGYRKIYRD